MSRVERNQSEYGKAEKSGGAGSFPGRLLSAIGTIILVLSIVMCLGMAVPRFMGISQYVVISGSMEPAIPVGSIVYAEETEPSSLAEGDVIVFYGSEAGGTPVTHRVVENHVQDGEVITKGDANSGNDLSPVMYQNIIGRVKMHIPMLGFIVSPLSSMSGKIGALCIIVGAYLLTVLGGKLK